MTEQRGIERLKAIMATLRGECGCPWDRKQTIPSLKPYVIEEAYEVVEAMDEGPDELQDELGDLLLQVVFIAQMAQEEGLFDFDSVAERISDKLVRRHPHVFGTTQVKDADEVVQNWNQIKKDKEAKKYLMDGIPTAMPATAPSICANWLTSTVCSTKPMCSSAPVSTAMLCINWMKPKIWVFPTRASNSAGLGLKRKTGSRLRIKFFFSPFFSFLINCPRL